MGRIEDFDDNEDLGIFFFAELPCQDITMSNLKKISDEEKESMYGYVFAVSGPGKSKGGG